MQPQLPEVKSVFDRALEIDVPAERQAYLDRIGGEFPEVRVRVEELLRAYQDAGSFLQGVTQDEAPRERPGTVIGPYKLLQQIGEGGMGVVYMAEQETPVRRRVALKIIKPGMDSAQVVARFEAERQALALMDHQSIARVLEAGATDSGRPYFVMELVHGVPITKYCDDNKLTPRQRLELFVPVCQAVQHAHQKGIIHRDLKPSNILVTLYDGKPVPKVIDFGVAKATEQRLTERTLFTQYGTIVGTFEYMAPEQAEMSALGVDTRSDVYSLGVLLYELLTGTTPLEQAKLRGAALVEMLRLIREEEPPKPSARISTSGQALATISQQRGTEASKLSRLVRGELDWIVMKALEKDRTRRYETASGLARDLDRYLKDEPVEACPPSAGYRLRKFVRKHKTPLAAATAFALLLVGGILLSSWQAVRATNAESLARTNELIASHERDETTTANNHLRDSQEDLRRTLYYARSNLLQNAWDTNNIGQVFDLLEQQRPGVDERDLRGFEWYYRDRLAHQELLTITVPPGDWQSSIIPAFSPDGRSFVANAKVNEGETGFALAVYDLNTGRERLRLQPDKNEIPNQLCLWSPDSKRILVRLDVGSSSRPQNPGGPGEPELAVYDATTGNEIFRLKSPRLSEKPRTGFTVPHEPAFSADGKYLVAGWSWSAGWSGSPVVGSDRRPVIVIVDATTGKQILIIPDVYPNNIALSPDGRRFAVVVETADKKGTMVKVWDVASGKELFTTASQNGNIHQLTFSPDGTHLVGAVLALSARGTIRGRILVWDALSGQEQYTLGANDGPGGALGIQPRTEFAFSPNGKMLAAVLPGGASSTYVNLWDLETGKIIETLHDSAGASHFQFSPDGKMLAAADGSIARVWEIGATPFGSFGAPAFVFRGHTNEIVNINFHPDGTRLLTATSHGLVKVWDLSIRQRPVTIQPNRTGFPKEPGGVFSATRPFVFSAATGRLVTVTTAEISADADEVQQVKVWDLSGQLLHSYPELRLSPQRRFAWSLSSYAFSPDGKLLAKVASTKQVPQLTEPELQVLEADTGKIVYTVKESRPIQGWSIVFSPDGKRLAWSVRLPSKDATDQFDTAGAEIKVLDASNGQEIQKIVADGKSMIEFTFNRDGTRLAAVLTDPLRFSRSASGVTVDIWDATTGEKVQTLESAGIATSVSRLAYSRDGARLAAILQRGQGPGPGGRGPESQTEVAVWDTTTGRRRYTLGHVGSFSQVTFNHDGSRLATVSGALRMPPFRSGSGSNGGVAVKIWDAATGNELLTLKDLSANTVPYVEFSPDGTHLYAMCQVASGSIPTNRQDIEIRVWDATPRPEAKQR